MSRGRILFVDDEIDIRKSANDLLRLSGFEVETAGKGDDGLEMLRADRFDVIVSDIRMPGTGGMELLEGARAHDPDLPVVLLTGHGDIALAVEAMHRGAHDFLEKPYDADHLIAVLDRAASQRRVTNELERLKAAGSNEARLEDRVIGLSPAMVEIRKRIAQLADVDVDILIRGETGTGKEVVARALHDFGARSRGAFVAINCSAIPESVFESEIFGHVKGAFTGAADRRTGKFEHANRGTVFLDEIESMPLALQAKVLRAIQERQFEPLGSNRPVEIDVRFLAATKVNLKAESDAGRFRRDLYYRLCTVELCIPPLRERKSDAALLFRHFLSNAFARFNMPIRDVPLRVIHALQSCDWPGNVRELKAHAERYALGVTEPDNELAEGGASAPLAEKMAAYEASLISAALEKANGVTRDAAEMLGVPRRTLAEKMARLGIGKALAQQ